MKTYYVGMDVHRASIVMVVLNGAGKVVMQSVIETGAKRVRGYLKQLRGKVYVTFEEGTQANWLHDVVATGRYTQLMLLGFLATKSSHLECRIRSLPLPVL
jgi:hypothetical protein